MPSQSRRYATIPQAADYLQCGVRTVWRMINSGEVTAYRLHARGVRLDLNEIDAKLQPLRTIALIGGR